jgi:2-dehydropantoate 2-reductase
VRILVLGAGAIGGYFGGRLVQAGGDVTILVRERRGAQLREHGLVVRSPHGDFTAQPRWCTREQIGAPADLVLLTCKAYAGVLRAAWCHLQAAEHRRGG